MKKIFKSRKRNIVFALVIVFVGAISWMGVDDEHFKIAKNLDIYYTLFRELNMFYVDEVDPEKLVEESIDGMLESLDPYTTYIPEKDMDDFKFMTTGKYGGIGALIRKSGDYTIISEPYEGFPAQKSGLKAGDKIKEIDGKSIKNMEVSEVSEFLKGDPNTDLEVLIERIGVEKEFIVKIRREVITIKNVPYYGMLNEKTGYILISNFTQNLGDEVRSAVNELKENPELEYIVLDLRNNPGGLLIEAVNTANVFIPKDQEVVSTKGKVKRWDNTYKTESQPLDTSIKLAVLVNRASASASEIVAGALQDLDRAIVLGQKTFGKGLVQTTRPLSYNTQLKVTTAKYYIPSGRCIQALDYTHRNEDGSVGYIPDSLISEFETKSGRKVYDGGGITPDVSFKAVKPSRIAISLYTKNLIFDFATDYAASHDTIASAETFDISDELYDEFIEFLSDKEYDYTTETDKKIKELIKAAKREKYYHDAEDEFKALQQKMAHDKTKDLTTFKNEIKELLVEEIIGRYYYQKGKIIAGIRFDKDIEEALDILNDNVKYDSVLTARYVGGNKLADEETEED